MWPNTKPQNYDKTQTQFGIKLKLWQNSNSICDKTQKNKLWQNSKTQNMTVVIVTVVTVAVVTVVLVTSFSKNNLTPQQRMRCS